MANRVTFQPIDFKTRFPALDGVRALAVTMVFLDHFAGGSHGGRVLQVLDFIRQRMWSGVDLFFALSGFLITGILFDTRHDSKFFRRFFARRSLRIFPVFYLVAAIALALTPFFHFQWHPQHLWFLVYMGNWVANGHFELYVILSATHRSASLFIGHFWSLCAEEQFYLLWPPVVWLVRDRVRLIYLAGILCLATLVLRIWWCFHEPLPGLWIVRTLPFRVDTLLFGAILALVLRGPNADAWQRSLRWVFPVSLLCTGVVYLHDQNGPLVLTAGLSLAAIASTALIGLTLVPGSVMARLFYLKPLRIIGKYSYGFYIYNGLWMWGWIIFLYKISHRTHSLVLAGLVELPLNYAVSFLLAKLSYDFFEVKFLRFKRKFEYDSEIAEHKHAFVTK